jgi:hypothetical protein
MGAEKGTLSFMVGCRTPLYERVLSILSHMGPESSIFHCGSSGKGLKTKLLNNYLSSITTSQQPKQSTWVSARASTRSNSTRSSMRVPG